MFRSLSRFFTSTKEFTKFERHGKVGLITLNRPDKLNALGYQIVTNLNTTLQECDDDPDIHCMIVTGAEIEGKKSTAFAAGADIAEMQNNGLQDNYLRDFLDFWNDIAKIRKPIIGAINGFALGGGCEIAMMMDILYASEKAKFGQPEIKLGTIPGAGGTQRLTKAIGKSRTMELVLTGDMMDAEEAKQRGLVSKVFPHADLIPEAIKCAEKIASMSNPIVKIAKECVNVSYETTLSQGLLFERRQFHATFGFEDRKEGMTAFVEKRAPEFKNN